MGNAKNYRKIFSYNILTIKCFRVNVMAKKTSHIKFFRKVLFHSIMTHIKIPNCDNSINKSTKDRKEPKRKEFFLCSVFDFSSRAKKKSEEEGF